MIVVLVFVQVKPEWVEAFKTASIENAQQSVQEPGIARFDVIQQKDDPNRFILVEVYRTEGAQAAHKETAHYAVWRDRVAEMMAEGAQGSSTRTSILPMKAGEKAAEMEFEFATATRILFGPGRLKEIGKIGAGFGSKALVATPFKPGAGLFTRMKRYLDEQGMGMIVLAVTGEPTVESVQAGVELARDTQCDWVIGFGGGSAIDTAKAIAGLATQSGGMLEYLEVIGNGRAMSAAPLPFVAVPTTAGTGAEVTRNAVIGCKRHG